MVTAPVRPRLGAGSPKLVDDHEVARDGIKALLAAHEDIVVCAEAASVRQAVAEADRALPDVIVMDVRLQDGSGIEATRDIRAARPHTQVLMLTSFADDQALFASILAGAAGYVLKQIRGDDLVQAIRTVGAGQSLLDPAVTKGVLDRLRKGKHLPKHERLARLSPQEERILELVSAGRTNKQIGEELHLAEKTVKTTSPASWPSSRSPAGPRRLPTSPATPPPPAPSLPADQHTPAGTSEHVWSPPASRPTADAMTLRNRIANPVVVTVHLDRRARRPPCDELALPKSHLCQGSNDPDQALLIG